MGLVGKLTSTNARAMQTIVFWDKQEDMQYCKQCCAAACDRKSQLWQPCQAAYTLFTIALAKATFNVGFLHECFAWQAHQYLERNRYEPQTHLRVSVRRNIGILWSCLSLTDLSVLPRPGSATYHLLHRPWQEQRAQRAHCCA